MGYYYEEERRVREAIEKLIICSGQINDVYRLYEEMFGENDLDEAFNWWRKSLCSLNL